VDLQMIANQLADIGGYPHVCLNHHHPAQILVLCQLCPHLSSLDNLSTPTPIWQYLSFFPSPGCGGRRRAAAQPSPQPQPTQSHGAVAGAAIGSQADAKRHRNAKDSTNSVEIWDEFWMEKF